MSLSKFIDKDKGWAALFARALLIKKGKVKVGVLADDKKGGLHKTDPVTGKASPLTVAEIAAVLEFGTRDGRIPPRPVLTAAFEKHRAEMLLMSQAMITAVLLGKMTKKRALGLLGEFLKSKAQAMIAAGVKPDNAPSTIRRKTRTGKGDASKVKPWIDTGQLYRSFAWLIED